jgi:hypothetical protein
LLIGKNDVLHNYRNGQRKNRMIDLILVAGQPVSVIGLAYGGYLSLSYRFRFGDAREKRPGTACVHHRAAA